MRKTTNSINKWKKTLTALYKKYRGQLYNWGQSKMAQFREWRKNTHKQYGNLSEKAKDLTLSFKNRLETFIKKFIKQQPLKDRVEDLLNRQVYARKIADVIEKRHKEGNVIFAVSGKWGSGKTRILQLLEPLLREKEFKVVWFDTWSYSQEPISLKRAFLKALTKGLNKRVDLTILEQDSTQLKFSIKNLIRFFSFILLVFTLVTLLPFVSKNVPGSNLEVYILSYLYYTYGVLNTMATSEITKLLIIPITLFLFTDVFTLKQTTSKITTAEEFRSKFNEIIEDEAKVVIFVDDLDRCTPEVVKQILDALVTFFRNECCSFVVTGDHTVIEQYVGGQLNIAPVYSPNGIKDENKTRIQERSEGRRFLKKLFDIYWQIPSPEPARFKEYVEKEIKKLDIKNLDNSKQKQLVNLLSKFLEPNPRAVVRFLTALSFNLDTLAYMIDEKKNGTGDNSEPTKELADIELKGLEEVVKEPTLLAKVLLIQESFYPLYEELVQKPDVLPLHEKEVRRKGDVTTALRNKPVKDILVRDEDLGLYKELLRTPPNFTNENDAVIFNADNFLYLSGFTGLPSQKGPDEEWFLQSLKTATEAKDLIANLGGASETRQKQLLTLSQKALMGSTEVTEKQNIARNMAEIMLGVNAWSGGFDALVAKLVEANFIHGLQPPVRTKLASLVFQFTFEKDVNVASFFTSAPWNDAVYVPVRWEAAGQSKTLSVNAVTNLASVNDGEFGTNENDAIIHLKTLVEKSNQEEQAIQTQLKPLLDKLVTAIFTKPTDQTRLQMFQVLKDVDRKKLSKDVLIQKQTEIFQGSNYQSEIQFYLSNQQQLSDYLEANKLRELRKSTIDVLKNRGSVDWNPLADVLLVHQPWEVTEKNLIMDAIFHHLQSSDAGMFSYAFDYLKKPGVRKFVQPIMLLGMLSQLSTTVGEERKETVLDYLNKTNWPEVAELGHENQNRLMSLAKGRGSIPRKAKEVLKSWGLKVRGRI